MSLDAVKNFAKVEVSTGYDASATSIVLSAGEGAKLPDPSTDGEFNLVWWNSTDYQDPSDDPNVEIVRCTARSTDTLTVTRNQEGSGASTKNTGGKTYKMVLTPTKRTIDNIYAQTQWDAVVDANGDGDYTSVADAVDDNKTKIFVRDGAYSEPEITITQDGTWIIGESVDGVVITSTEDGAWTRAITYGAVTDLRFENFTLKGKTGLVTYEGIRSTSTNQPRLTVKNVKFSVFYYNFINPRGGEQCLIENCVFDKSDRNNVGAAHVTEVGYASTIKNCHFIDNNSYTSLSNCLTTINGRVADCWFENFIQPYFSGSGAVYEGNYMEFRRAVFTNGDTLFTGNYIYNNGDPGAGNPMMGFSGANTKVMANTFTISYFAREPVEVSGSQIVFCNNYINSGRDINISGDRNQFHNNIWASTGGIQTIDIALSGDRNQVNQNTLQGYSGNTPTITNTGSNNNVLNNILYS